MRLTTFSLFAAAFCAALPQAHAVQLYLDTDPGSGPVASGTLINVPDPLLDDGAGDTAGLFSDLTAKFSSVGTGDHALPPSAIGNPFEITVDYLVPSNSELNDGDLIYLQVNIDGNNRGSVGFANAANVTPDVWNTLTLTNLNFPGGDPTNGPNIPAGSMDINATLIIADNGFGPGNDFPGGPALLFDNFSITVVPEPTTLLLAGLGLLAAARRR